MAAFFLHIPGRRDFQPNIDGRPADVSKRSTAVFVVFFFAKKSCDISLLKKTIGAFSGKIFQNDGNVGNFSEALVSLGEISFQVLG